MTRTSFLTTVLRRDVAAIRIAFLAACLAANGAAAQSFVGSGPLERFTVPAPGAPPRAPTPPGPRPDAPAQTSPTAGRVSQASTPIVPARRLPANTRGMRLSGEFDSLRFPVFLTPGQTRGATRMRVSYLSAISVAPESSELSVTINGQKVGWTRIQAPGAVKVVEFAIPEGTLRPGTNAVILTASQRHRVDCSVDATYELWTQIDASRTGLVIQPAGQDLDLRTLAALEPDESGALPVRLVLGEKPSLGRLQRMIEAVQAVALVGRLARPSVEFGAPMPGRAGVNLLVGTATELRGVEGLEGLGPITDPKVALLPHRADRAPTLVVTGPGDQDVAEAVRILSRAQSQDLPAGEDFAKLVRGTEVWGGETLSLKAVGVASQEFNGRLLRTRFELRLPADFVPADYGKIMLHLAGASVAGLSPDAQIVVDVNGRNAASVPLAYGKGELFEDSPIPLPLGMWRPGLNVVDISAQVPTVADRTCDTLVPASSEARLLMLDKTWIEIPRLARAVRTPDLAAIKGGAIPFVASNRRPRLVLPTPDRDSAAAAAMIAARLAIAAKRLIDFELVSDDTSPGGAALVVAPARALSPGLLAGVGLDPDRIRRAWEGRAETVIAPGQGGAEGTLTLDRLRRNIPIRCALPSAMAPPRVSDATSTPRRDRPPPAPVTRVSEPEATASAQDDVVAKWDRRLRGGPTWFDRVAEAGGTVSDGAQTLWRWARDGWGAKAPPETTAFDSRASLIIAESAGATAREASVTLVTAPNAWLLKASASCLVDPVVWTNLVGRAAYLDAADGTFTIEQPETVSLIETQPRSPLNLWVISAAWLSLNPAVYVALTLFMALCLGLATAALVRDVGRRNR